MLFPTTRDELVECAALLRGTRAGMLDAILPPVAPLDIVAQQVVAECTAGERTEDDLFGLDYLRIKTDLTSTTQARFFVNVITAGAGASTELRVQYSTDQAAWNYLDGGTGPSVAINTTGLRVSSWATITAGAKQDVFIRVVGINGDGVADPAFGTAELQIK